MGLHQIEYRRCEVVRRSSLWQAAGHPLFLNIASVAAASCAAPIALVTVIEAEHARIAAAWGAALSGDVPRSAFCEYVLRSERAFAIGDLAADARFNAHPQVVGPPGLRAFAGAPIVDGEGIALGAVAVMDIVSRPFTGEALRALDNLAEIAASLAELRL